MQIIGLRQYVVETLKVSRFVTETEADVVGSLKPVRGRINRRQRVDQ